MVYTNSVSILIWSILFILISCSKSEEIEPMQEIILNLPEEPFDYASINYPDHFTTDIPGQPLPTSINGTDNTPIDNIITKDGATLGRVLFYDKKLYIF